ncbi:MAG: HAD-IA family hydrolase [Acidobacteria bacterium]|nr:HAD-IA family hydrolase [Acidobacteriota bacterium]
MAPPPNRSIQAVFFDVGNTLVHVHPSVGEVYSRLAESHGVRVPAGTIQEHFDAAWEEMASRVPEGVNRYRVYPGGELGWWRDIVKRTFEGTRFQPEDHFDDFFDAFASESTWRRYPDAERVLEELSGLGLKLGVISNWDSRLPVLLEALGLRKYFSLVLYSAAEDVEKPAAEIFRRAACRSGVKPGCALHVGDRLVEDYQGAKGAGLQALLVARNGGSGVNGADVVSDLTQVSGYL